jgi:uncharacterized ParB-like nuclease family protein
MVFFKVGNSKVETGPNTAGIQLMIRSVKLIAGKLRPVDKLKVKIAGRLATRYQKEI